MKKAGFAPGRDFMIAMDPAVSEWYQEESGVYFLPKAKKTMTRQQMVTMWKNFVSKYPSFRWRTAWARRTGRAGRC